MLYEVITIRRAEENQPCIGITSSQDTVRIQGEVGIKQNLTKEYIIDVGGNMVHPIAGCHRDSIV